MSDVFALEDAARTVFESRLRAMLGCSVQLHVEYQLMTNDFVFTWGRVPRRFVSVPRHMLEEAIPWTETPLRVDEDHQQMLRTLISKKLREEIGASL